MCWNENISLNTFAFSIFALCFIIYNNTYTPYKIPVQGIFVYLFFLSFIVMQLNEFFLWRNLNNHYNHIFSIVGVFILFLQPFFSLLMIENELLKYSMSAFYLLFGLPIVTYSLSTKSPITRVQNGHLAWDWFTHYPIVVYVWLFLLFFSLFYNGWYMAALFGIVLYLYHVYKYKNGTFPSVWCWSINSIFIIALIYILIYLPLVEN